MIGYRQHQMGSPVMNGFRIEIVRVIHAARDVRRVLEDGEA